MKRFFIIVIFLFIPLASSAQFDTMLYLRTAITGAGYSDEQAETRVLDIAVNIINGAIILFGIAFLIMVLYGGWLWMTAAGNQDRVDRAKNVLKWATIGIAIVIASLTISFFLTDVVLRATGNTQGLDIN